MPSGWTVTMHAYCGPAWYQQLRKRCVRCCRSWLRHTAYGGVTPNLRSISLCGCSRLLCRYIPVWCLLRSASGPLLRHLRNVHIQVAGFECGDRRPLRWPQGIWHIPKVVGVLSLRVVHTMKLPEHAKKIGLTMPQMAEDHLARSPQSAET